jgi:hypothetical protein
MTDRKGPSLAPLIVLVPGHLIAEVVPVGLRTQFGFASARRSSVSLGNLAAMLINWALAKKISRNSVE